MPTQEERNRIRTGADALLKIKPKRIHPLSVIWCRNTIIRLLDALEETEKQICYKCHDANVNDEDGMSDILADRDHRKARAEALERAITDKELNKDYCYMGYGQQEFACQLCIYKDASCVCSDLENWEFDESRFTGGIQQ